MELSLNTKHLLQHKDYADSIYHSQQTAEKCVKAILILEKLFVRDRIVSDFFVDIMNKFKQRKELLDVLKDIKDLEKHCVRPRYSFISKHLIWNPLEEYRKKRC